jgi:hypothetical protein
MSQPRLAANKQQASITAARSAVLVRSAVAFFLRAEITAAFRGFLMPFAYCCARNLGQDKSS